MKQEMGLVAMQGKRMTCTPLNAVCRVLEDILPATNQETPLRGFPLEQGDETVGQTTTALTRRFSMDIL